MNNTPHNFRDWVPAFLSGAKSAPVVEWCYLGPDRFTHPFFEDTIRRRMRLPFNSLFRRQTSIDFLGEYIDAPEIIPPTGFVFHMSRCGSTLVTQLLAALEKNIVMSEPPLIDWVIGSTGTAIPAESRAQWLQWIVRSLGCSRNGCEENYVVKFDAWNTLDLDLITTVFPSVPLVFIYRDPVEVVVSQLVKPGLHAVPGALGTREFDLDQQDGIGSSREEYIARVLASICSSALEYADDERMLLVKYDQLPDVLFGAIAQHFGLTFSEVEVELMKKQAAFDAKNPQLSFTSDSTRKQNEASDAVRQAVAKWLDPVYEKLEARRQR